MPADNVLFSDITYLKGVGGARADILRSELHIYTFYDLLTYYPFRYIDKSKIYHIREITPDTSFIQIKGRILQMEVVGQNRASRLVALFTDGVDTMELVWFNSIRWLQNSLKLNQEYLIFGKPSVFNGKYSISHPEMELVSDAQSPIVHFFQPLYSSTDKAKRMQLDSRGISRLVYNLLSLLPADAIEETLPQHLLQSLHLMGRKEALYNIHFPTDNNQLQRALARLRFDELFFVQMGLLQTKQLRLEKQKGYAMPKVGQLFNEFYAKGLPFGLTDAQKRVIKEIFADLKSGKQMNRLLQGDVGSGKTITALLVMLLAIDNGYQACLMAPTEILAQQHYEKISKMITPFGVRVELLTGSTRKSQRKKMFAAIEAGEVHICIGTHALLEDTVQFANLGLAVIDEQHRFGVAQRAKLWTKNNMYPHVLVMTATPIPRTLAMTVYGDLDVSVIDQLPPGRKPVRTLHFFDNYMNKVLDFMRQQLALGRQVYVVYPLIEESAAMDLKHVDEGFEWLSKTFYPTYNVCMVHGRMKPAEKEEQMQRFVSGKAAIMVATTVIEVGVDVPNASVMVIQNAERFGLSQLHQLRGRVGRGADQSYCILMSSVKLSAYAKKRLETMVETTDGFKIAEMDMKLRGPGDIQGTQQSGDFDFKLADIVRDERMLTYTRELAVNILKEDPQLALPQNECLRKQLSFINSRKGSWEKIS